MNELHTTEEAGQIEVWFTQREAAEACQVHIDTIKRRRRSGDFPNARQDDQDIWLISRADLLTAGLTPGKPTAPDPQPKPTPPTAPAQPEAAALAAEVAGLRAQLDERQLRLDEIKAFTEQRLEDVTGRVKAIERSKAVTEARLNDVKQHAQEAIEEAKKQHHRAENWQIGAIGSLIVALAALAVLVFVLLK